MKCPSLSTLSYLRLTAQQFFQDFSAPLSRRATTSAVIYLFTVAAYNRQHLFKTDEEITFSDTVG